MTCARPSTAGLTLLEMLVVLALLGFVLLRGPKAPPGGYDSTRDADDPAPGASGDGSDEHARAGGGTATETKAPSLDTPESAGSRMARLRGRLAKSNNVFGRGLLALLSRDHIDQDVWDEIEETLLLADLGSEPSQRLVEALQTRVRVEGRSNTIARVLPASGRSAEAPAPTPPAITRVWMGESFTGASGDCASTSSCRRPNFSITNFKAGTYAMRCFANGSSPEFWSKSNAVTVTAMSLTMPSVSSLRQQALSSQEFLQTIVWSKLWKFLKINSL